jgi:site-specific DNA recombinase
MMPPLENGVPAIIDKDTYNAVQVKMAHNKGVGGRFKAKEIYLLSGLIVCGECGGTMHGNSRLCGRNKSRYVSYRCTNRSQCQGCTNKEVRKEYLKNFVLDSLYNCLLNEDSIKKLSVMLVDYQNKQAEENKDELLAATNELKSVTAKISSIIKLVSEVGVSIDTVKDDLKLAEDKKIYLEKYINELTYLKRESLITEEEILELVNQSKEFVKTKNLVECRQFIKTYINKVIVYNDRVEVVFNINIPNESVNTIEAMKNTEDKKALLRDYKVAAI